MSQKPEIESPVPKRLKAARKKMGLTQKNLGIMAGIPELSASARMNQYEKGVYIPDFEVVKRLASILQVPTSYFFEEDDEMAAFLVRYYTVDAAGRHRIMALINVQWRPDF